MSVIEVERKRELVGTRAAVTARLDELGYRLDGSFVEVDTYYSRPEVDYLDTVECLRVRQRDGFAEITYKPASDASTHSRDYVITKRETNVALRAANQAEAANHLLTALGMIRLVRVEKTRARYRHPDRGDITISSTRSPAWVRSSKPRSPLCTRTRRPHSWRGSSTNLASPPTP